MSLSDKATREFKDLMKKEYGQELSDAEAKEQGERLLQLAEILIKQAQIEHKRKQRLKKEPKGFHLDESEGTYNCQVCHKYASGKETWWDKWGVKCLDCQRNIDEGVIPREICQNDKLWIKDWQLRSDYSLHPSTARRLRREGILKGRDLKTKDGAIYYTVYLISENQEFLKKYPKKDSKIKMTASGLDGKTD